MTELVEGHRKGMAQIAAGETITLEELQAKSEAAQVAAVKAVLEWVYERYGLADVEYAEPPDIDEDVADFVASRRAASTEDGS